jgi:CRP-like cAMP-binding protein
MSKESAFQALKFEANKVVLAEGDLGDQAYLIREGVVEIRKGAYGESPRVLARLGPSDVFGEMALIDNRPHMASAITTEPTELVAISREEFDRRLKDMDLTMRALFKLMSHRVWNMAEEMVGWPDDVNWADWRPKVKKSKSS